MNKAIIVQDGEGVIMIPTNNVRTGTLPFSLYGIIQL